jgi:tRNA dimethylallyltransferase
VSDGRVFVLTGPTAAGKKSVSALIWPELGAEILSLDSMKVYRGMDVGTDKWRLAGVPVHLIDLVEPNEVFSVGRYLEAAGAKVPELAARGKAALFVGGTGLYLKALVDGLFEGPSADAALRERLRGEVANQGSAALHARLASMDPAAAARINPRDARRIVRALEVQELTGRPISALWRERTRRVVEGEIVAAALRYERAHLRERIAQRVERMFAAGLVEECRRIEATTGFSQETRNAIGYREALAHLHGELSLADAIAATTQSTFQFARRQETWFRQFKSLRWVEVTRASTAEQVADRVRHALR